MKRSVYHSPVTVADFTAEKTLEFMDKHRDAYVRDWGLEVWEQRRLELVDYIQKKQSKANT